MLNSTLILILYDKNSQVEFLDLNCLFDQKICEYFLFFLRFIKLFVSSLFMKLKNKGGNKRCIK